MLQKCKGFLNRIYSFKLLRRHAQDEIDVERMFLYTSFYKNYNLIREKDPTFGEGEFTNEELEALTDFPLAQKMNYYERYSSCRKILDKQVLNLFNHVYSTGGINPYPKPIFKESSKYDDLLDTYLKKKMNITDVEIFNPGLEMQHPDGFKFQVVKSKIDHPESGYGVFINGEAIPGTVVAIYPGVVYYPQDLTLEITSDNEYMIRRYDDIIIDGKHWDRRQEIMAKNALYLPYATGSRVIEDEACRYKNQFAIGQYINHPPKGSLPNVMSFSYDFPDSLPKEYKKYVPHVEKKSKYILNIKSGDIFMKSILIVTTRLVQNEELFLNYRYNPENPHPDWYEGDEEAKNRWSSYRLFN